MKKRWILWIWSMTCVLPGFADEATQARIEALEKKVDILLREKEQSQFGGVYIEPVASTHGMGPSASKIYEKAGGLSIGGYGEALYQNFQGEETDEADFLRAILYFGYKFNDRWLLNTEIEFEHADKAYVEFAYVDYLPRDEFNVRAGLVLVPVGLVNELHEPTLFLGARRPDVETRIIPTTWRENGAGIFGALGPVSYKAFVVNGLKGEDFSAAGLRGGRQKGSQALAEDFAGALRLDVAVNDTLTLGGAVYHGDSGQDLDMDLTTTLVEGHFTWAWRGLELRGLAVQGSLDDSAALSRRLAGAGVADADINAVGDELEGWYIEAGYNVLNEFSDSELQIIPFARYESFDTQAGVPDGFVRDGANDVEVWTLGVNVKPLEEIVFKADIQLYDNAAGTGEDQINLALGYLF